MKKIIITSLSLLIVLTFLLAACQQAPQPSATPTGMELANVSPRAAINVLAVETFLAEIAQNVAGERATVESLVPLGVDPHTFQPTPQDVAKIADSNVLILNGAGFEEWAAETLQNAGGERAVIEASAGLTQRQAAEGEVAHEDDEADNHSVESHSRLVCEQLEGKIAEEEIQAGAEATGAVELHGAEEHIQGEHAHEREIVTLKLNATGEGRYAGYVLFDAEAEESYAFTAGTGEISVINAEGETLEVGQALPLDCGGMSQGQIFKLLPGEYVLVLSGFASETTPFSAAPVHEHHEGEEHEGEHHHEGDPHFWLDPLHVAKYVENIRDGLIAADPDGKDVYTQNAAAYITQLNDLDAWIKAQVAAIPTERRLIVTNHESFGYFADRYGFQIIGTIIPSFSSGSSPSAQQMAELVEHIQEAGAIAIFLETGSNPKLAEQIAAETGIQVVSELYTHSITDVGGKAPTYIDMMKFNVNAIVEALK
ncbi:MAG: metal ABC transporter substrate-binding protein [Chloroflexota bacterium]